MTPERYSQVKKLFQLVLEQPAPQRPGFLERACGADRELYGQVRELLKADFTSNKFLEKSAVPPISKVLAEAASEMQEIIPSQIGPYAIHKLIGSGGMGAVYLATRADKTYTKQVALKVIRKGMESERILQRFHRERQIVASLDHPNIARLLDGGATEDGRPYFVMEYVEGLPVDTWCDQRRLNTTQRLRLFLQICDAIHYAHQNLIIHRDIKPGNILVRPDGTVKLLDFGIAKLLNSDPNIADAEKTATAMRLMTPQYASPEQIRGDSVTTASDVYLLGILLYELLTGHRPFEVPNNATIEDARQFTHSTPQQASEAIFRVAGQLTLDGGRTVPKNALTISATREGNPAALLKTLRGDVDAILSKCLRRNPAERYQSTSQIADDIRHHLELLPVTARPANSAYRVRLFLRRHKTLTLAGATALFLLLSVAVFALWQAAKARNERIRAEARFNDVRRLSNALLFDVQEVLAPLPGTTPARRILVNKAVEYLNNLSHEPFPDDALRREIAAGYLRVGNLQGNPNYANLGDPSAAAASYKQAQSLQETILKGSPNNVEVQNELAGTLESVADILAIQGDTNAALHTLRRAVELRETGNAGPASKAASYHSLAVALAANGLNSEALALARKAHQLAQSLNGPDTPRQLALSHSKLAAVLLKSGDSTQAAENFRAALQIREKLASADPNDARAKRDLANSIEDLADLETRIANSTAASTLYRRSLQLRRDLTVADPENIHARRDLAFALLKNSYTNEALDIFRQLALLDPANTVARRDLAIAYEQRGDMLLLAGEREQALSMHQQFLQAARDWVQRDTANPNANHLLATAHIKMAEALPNAGDRDGGLSSARSAIRILEELLAKDKDNSLFRRDRAYAHWILGKSLTAIAAPAGQPGPWREAEAQLQTAKKYFSELNNRLSGTDTNIPKAIETEIQNCRQALDRLR